MENPMPVFIADRQLHCPHCDNDRFFQQRWLLSPAAFSHFKLDWENRAACNYVCSVCGRIEWFIPPPTEVLFSAPEGDFDCLECGEVIPHGSTKCPKCGWTYAAQ